LTASTPITFLSDYGVEDEFVGVCHAVMARVAPGTQVIDLVHGIPRHDVRSAAIVLRRSLPYCQPGVHLAIVDPGVGGSRRGVALRTIEEDRLLVGPDNGLLSLAAQRFGGIAEIVDLARSKHRLEPVSHTFHGRDIFAPVAAALAAGAPLADAGDPIETDEFVQLEMPLAHPSGVGELTAHAVAFDRYGNVTLDVEHDELTSIGLRLGQGVTINGVDAVYGSTFSDAAVGNLLVYQDPYRTLSVAVNRGSARDRLALQHDDTLTIRAT
jgi:S-adenosylmethionine hydrolase